MRTLEYYQLKYPIKHGTLIIPHNRRGEAPGDVIEIVNPRAKNGDIVLQWLDRSGISSQLISVTPNTLYQYAVANQAEFLYHVCKPAVNDLGNFPKKEAENHEA